VGSGFNPSIIRHELCHHTGDVMEGQGFNPSNIVNPNNTRELQIAVGKKRSTRTFDSETFFAEMKMEDVLLSHSHPIDGLFDEINRIKPSTGVNPARVRMDFTARAVRGGAHQT
jgi:hypothetical protein